MPTPIQVVIDTNVLVAALKSQRGAAFQLLFIQMGRTRKWEANASTALLCEYEEQAKRIAEDINLSFAQVDLILDTIANGVNQWPISRKRQPVLRDPDDDFLLDLARTAQAHYIVSFNTKDFHKAREYGIDVIEPGAFLDLIKSI